jgi:4'-phosphopantetheinyl transferase
MRIVDQFPSVVAPDLSADEVHVWQAKLDASPFQESFWEMLLSEDELARARRFHFSRDRRRFAVARSSLRVILGAYLGLDPERISFLYGKRGKPYLHPSCDSRGLQFNISHSGEVVLLGITLDRTIGVDIEQLRFDLEAENIAARFFSAAEQQSLAALPASQKYPAFFNCWTRKEAFIKAKGDGLFLPLNQFDVSLEPGAPPKLLATRPNAKEASRWSFAAPDTPAGYVAAVIVESGIPLKCCPCKMQ